MLGVPLDEVPIADTVMSGTTDSNGNQEFMMLPTTKYKINTTLTGYTFPTMYIVPHDTEYIISANSATPIWALPIVAIEGTKIFTVSKLKIDDTHGQISFVYNDSSGTTTGGFVNITNKGVLVYTYAVTNNSFNITTPVTISTDGTSMMVSAKIITSQGNFNRDIGVSFDGKTVPVGIITPTLLMWIAFGLILLTSLISGYREARYVAVMVSVESWLFLSMGWFAPLISKIGMIPVVAIFSFATVITIIWNIREGKIDL
jgi:hypothetical protein